jgi:small-conductance mechanosensitive channel
MVALNDFIYGTFFENPYLRFISIVIFFYLISKVLQVIILGNIKRFTKKTKSNIDDLIIKSLRKPLINTLTLVGAKVALTVLPFSEKILETLQHILNSLIIIIIIFFAVKLADIIINNWGRKWASKTDSSLDDELLPLIHKATNVILIIIGSFFVLGEWSIDVTGLLAGVGIAGLALGFAIKDSLANIFGGISLILDKAIKVDDIVKLEDGKMGIVMDVGLRSTKIRTFNNELLIVPNGQIANSTIQNYKAPDLSVRINIPFGVEYGSDPDKVKKVVKDTISSIKKVIKNDKEKPIQVLFLNMGDSALEFSVRFWVNDLKDKLSTKEEAVSKIYKNLTKSKIGIPFPTRTIYMKKE